MPRDADSEMAVLGVLLLADHMNTTTDWPPVVRKIYSNLDDEDFLDPFRADVYRVLKRAHCCGIRHTDEAAQFRWLHTNGIWRRWNIAAFRIAELVAASWLRQWVPWYISRLRACRQRRERIALAWGSLADALWPEGDLGPQRYVEHHDDDAAGRGRRRAVGEQRHSRGGEEEQLDGPQHDQLRLSPADRRGGHAHES